jgi:hypothetical protein
MENADPVLDSAWFWVHVSSLLFAYASFALACVLGVVYVLQFTEIKKKHLGFLYTRLPSLQILDVMNSRAVAIGWVFLSVGVVAGLLWAAQARAVAPENLNLQAMVARRPEGPDRPHHLGGVLVRGGGAADARLDGTPRGLALGRRIRHRAAQLRPVSYFVTTSHTFQ